MADEPLSHQRWGDLDLGVELWQQEGQPTRCRVTIGGEVRFVGQAQAVTLAGAVPPLRPNPAIMGNAEGNQRILAADRESAVIHNLSTGLCPECAQGKHVNCTLTVPDLISDSMVPCPCRNQAHW